MGALGFSKEGRLTVGRFPSGCHLTPRGNPGQKRVFWAPKPAFRPRSTRIISTSLLSWRYLLVAATTPLQTNNKLSFCPLRKIRQASTHRFVQRSNQGLAHLFAPHVANVQDSPCSPPAINSETTSGSACNASKPKRAELQKVGGGKGPPTMSAGAS